MTKFKIGDRVRALDSFYPSIPRGTVSEVAGITTKGNAIVRVPGRTGNRHHLDMLTMWDDHLELFDEPKARFKVGDKVRVLEDGAHMAGVKRGDVGEITETLTIRGPAEGTSYTVRAGGDTWILRDQHLELVDAFAFALAASPPADDETITVTITKEALAELATWRSVPGPTDFGRGFDHGLDAVLDAFGLVFKPATPAVAATPATITKKDPA